VNNSKVILCILAGFILLAAILIVGLLRIDSHQRETDARVASLQSSLDAAIPKVDDVLKKQDQQDAILKNGLQLVAAGKWKIVETRTEVQHGIAQMAAAPPIPDTELEQRNRAVDDEFDAWLAKHYGSAVDLGGRAPEGTDVVRPPEAGGPDRKSQPDPR